MMLLEYHSKDEINNYNASHNLHNCDYKKNSEENISIPVS